MNLVVERILEERFGVQGLIAVRKNSVGNVHVCIQLCLETRKQVALLRERVSMKQVENLIRKMEIIWLERLTGKKLNGTLFNKIGCLLTD
jgi:hypothetical protein